jgi:hypothetical protein
VTKLTTTEQAEVRVMNMYGEYLTENLKGRDDVQDKNVNRRIILLDQ